MLNFLKNMLGLGPKTDFAGLVRNGATILDVRTKDEFGGGHIAGAVNIPIQELQSNMAKID
ncbi:MAG: rhodanese-like domain-containing protein, partial [Bacteroidota bacterium]